MPDDTIPNLIREIQGKRSLRKLAVEVGLDPSALSGYLLGRHPSLETTLKIADRAGLDPDLRRRWFAACRHADPRPGTALGRAREAATELLAELTYEPEMDLVELYAYLGSRGVPPEDREMIAAFIRASRAEGRDRQDRD